MTIKALKTRCIITRKEVEKTTASGIVLGTSNDDPNPRAYIHHVGPDVKGEISAGDCVVVDWRYVSQMEHDKQKYYVVDEQNILAVEE